MLHGWQKRGGAHASPCRPWNPPRRQGTNGYPCHRQRAALAFAGKRTCLNRVTLPSLHARHAKPWLSAGWGANACFHEFCRHIPQCAIKFWLHFSFLADKTVSMRCPVNSTRQAASRANGVPVWDDSTHGNLPISAGVGIHPNRCPVPDLASLLGSSGFTTMAGDSSMPDFEFCASHARHDLRMRRT